LSTVAHRLAIELEAMEPGEKPAFWHNVIGPVFEAIWPLDAELQSPRATFKLVQMLLAAGDAFPDAVDVIIPFIRPEDPRSHTSIYSLSSADDDLYRSSPDKMLDLASAIVGDASIQGIYGLTNVLNRIRQLAPHLASTRKFQRLASLAGAD
jgi:hypothetical protein